MSRKPRNVYFRDEPGNVTVENIRNGSFELVFEGRTEVGGKKRAVLKLDTWFVQYVARELWKVAKHQRAQLADNEAALRGGP